MSPTTTYRPVLCLPKSGSTSLTQWLEARAQPARHEWNTMPLLHLAVLQHRPDYQQRRRLWLRARAAELARSWDVNTALYAVLLPFDGLLSSDDPLIGPIQLQWLCRSPRPWLLSIIAWSQRFAADPQRRRWLQLHRGFVARCSPELAAAMPADPAGDAQLLRFWLPVWIAFQQQAIEHGHPYLLTEQLPPEHHANASLMAVDVRRRISALLPELPALQGEPGLDRACVARCRSWWAQLIHNSG